MLQGGALRAWACGSCSVPWTPKCLAERTARPLHALPQVLREVFGPELASEVAARYLQEQSNGRYRFRQQYSR